MKPIRGLVALLSLAIIGSAACAAGAGSATGEAAAPGNETAAAEEEDQAFGHALTLVELFVSAASRSDDPRASARAIDELLSGRNPEANRAFSGLFEDATTGLPPQQKERVAAIARNLAAAARREAARAPADPMPDAGRALQARKDLAAMGLRYYDEGQFLDAVRRDDALAVELYLIGKGVNVSARDAQGRTALDLARANKNAALAERLARSLPATR